MRRRSRKAFVGLFVLVLSGSACVCAWVAAGALAATVWNLDLHHNPTNFPPGGVGEYWVEVDNVGSTESAGPITLTVTLKPGLTRSSVREEHQLKNWSCPGSSGDSVITCTTNEAILRHSSDRHLVIAVSVGAKASGTRTISATLKGGNAAGEAAASEETTISNAPAGFGVFAPSFTPGFFEADGLTAVTEAGSHPALLTVPFDFNSIAAPLAEKPTQMHASQDVRDLTVDLPPGFIGNPTAVGDCAPAAFNVDQCPVSSQVGRVVADVAPLPQPTFAADFSSFVGGVFNLSHPRGAIADIGFTINANPIHIKASLDPANHYAIRTSVLDINETAPPFGQKVTIWGVPADSSHDSERCPKFSGIDTPGDTSGECPAGIEAKPFLSTPESCEGASAFRLERYDSWQHPGAYGPPIEYALPQRFTGCDIPRFEPSVSIEPTGKQANTPTGLNVRVHVPQNENPSAKATPPIKDTIVTLPVGMSFSPSFADGLTSCSLAQIKLGTNDPVECPDSSRIGEVSLSTPLLPRPLEGSMYLASQGDNPFGSLFGLYLVFHDDEERGILVKIAGKVEVDQATGQITAGFEETPQLPFEDLTLKFRSGSRAPLVNPPSCGTHTIGVKVSSWAQPGKLLDLSTSYDVSEGPGGTACPVDSAHRPFAPGFTGGTLSPVAGAYTPFLFRMTRSDAEQELSQITTTLPPGLSANVSQIPLCPASAIESISTELGTGRPEQEHPTCPAASQIGTVSAGLGAGPGPNYFPGKVYLSGPYKGAPLSLAVVAPGVAGPYDLGNVVVRAALFIDPVTARITAVSDPFPTIFHGIILRVRDVRIRIDRPETTINPTNCERTTVNGQITGVGGDLQSTTDDSQYAASAPFQVGDCASLAFKPSFKASTAGKTSRNNGASLTVKLAYPKAPQGSQTNIHIVKVDLPKQLPSRLTTLQKACTDAQFEANPAGCPAASRVGQATAITPILPVPLTGPAYFVSHGGAKFPELILVLQGYGITIDLHGETFISKTGITSSTFHAVPDQPVTSFELTLPQGPNSALAANGNLCLSKLKMPTLFVGQNGATIKQSTPISVTGCPKAKHKKAKKAHKASRHRSAHHRAGKK